MSAVKYKVYGTGSIVVNGRYHALAAGHLPHGPVTTWWHKNASFKAIAPCIVKTEYNRTNYTSSRVFKTKGVYPKVWPVCSTYSLAKFSDWGGVPLYYVTADNCALCAKCATEQATRRDRDWPRIIAVQPNYEDPALTCDNCNVSFESAYAEE